MKKKFIASLKIFSRGCSHWIKKKYSFLLDQLQNYIIQKD